MYEDDSNVVSISYIIGITSTGILPSKIQKIAHVDLWRHYAFPPWVHINPYKPKGHNTEIGIWKTEHVLERDWVILKRYRGAVRLFHQSPAMSLAGVVHEDEDDSAKTSIKHTESSNVMCLFLTGQREGWSTTAWFKLEREKRVRKLVPNPLILCNSFHPHRLFLTVLFQLDSLAGCRRGVVWLRTQRWLSLMSLIIEIFLVKKHSSSCLLFTKKPNHKTKMPLFIKCMNHSFFSPFYSELLLKNNK